jgi:hypothetical protein
LPFLDRILHRARRAPPRTDAPHKNSEWCLTDCSVKPYQAGL